MRPAFSLLLVTDRRASPLPLPRAVQAALSVVPPGAAAVQLREKDLGGRELAELARALLPICQHNAAPLLVNDRADVALAVGADGVHLARTSIPPADARALLGAGKLVGISCHSEPEVREAHGFADYALFGPVFDTPSKRAFGLPLGPAALRDASRAGLPLFAVGGVTAERIAELRGCHGVAAIGAALAANDPAAAVRRLWQALAQRSPSSMGT